MPPLVNNEQYSHIHTVQVRTHYRQTCLGSFFFFCFFVFCCFLTVMTVVRSVSFSLTRYELRLSASSFLHLLGNLVFSQLSKTLHRCAFEINNNNDKYINETQFVLLFTFCFDHVLTSDNFRVSSHCLLS